MARVKCGRCNQPLTNDDIFVSAQGDTFHRHCWQGSKKDNPSRDSDPLCPVCLRPIRPSDMVTGRRDDLIHADCDYARPQTSRPPR